MPITIDGGLPFCGRELTSSEWDLIREVTRDFCGLGLTELARTICELLQWKRPNGGLKGRECYLFLLTLRSRGWLPWLPPPRPQARHPHATKVDEQSDPQAPVSGSLAAWSPVQLERIDLPGQRQLFEQYIHRYHYLGYRVPYGAQLRYFVWSASPPRRLLACLLFTSAAWKMAPRDRYLGWSEAVRPQNLCRVVNNSRFLILPWVRISHLASHILSRAALATAAGLAAALWSRARAAGNIGGSRTLPRDLLSGGKLGERGIHAGPGPDGSDGQSTRTAQGDLSLSAGPALAEAVV